MNPRGTGAGLGVGRLRGRQQQGQASLLIVGFATVLLLMVAVVVDVSAAHLQRQALNNLAEGAALHGADRGVSGITDAGGAADVAAGTRLEVDPSAASIAVAEYLASVRASQEFPGLAHVVEVSGDGRVLVSIRAPMKLPLPVPGVSARTVVGTSAGAGVTVVR